MGAISAVLATRPDHHGGIRGRERLPVLALHRGPAKALTDPELVVGLVADPNLDVRKAAVRALARWVDDPAVALALKSATDDTDADVRAYARRGARVIGPGRPTAAGGAARVRGRRGRDSPEKPGPGTATR
ncbi:HEAT repeat domain-containing protein [Streptomyces sp. ID05-26A]|nr:HEAT repeat domain-containing protein [Streptomyces sp. ID05-26A]